MAYAPVRTVEGLETLDEKEIVEGYLDAAKDDPEPGPNRSRSYWHGWRNGMVDNGFRKGDTAMAELAHEVVVTGRHRIKRSKSP